MSTELVAVQTAVAEFDRVAAGLADLQARYANVVFDVSTTAGLEEAKTARAIIREPRYAVERLRANAKAPILELGRSLDTRAKEITSKILRIETPIDSQIKADVRRRASVRRRVGVRRRAREARKEAEKQAKIAAELKRVADLQARVVELRGCMTLTVASGARLIAEHIVDLENIPVDSTFAEYVDQAVAAKEAGVARLRTLHIAAVEHEAEQERIRAEREELERLRAAEEQRQATERQRISEENRKALAARETEEAERRRQRAVEDAERAERIAAENAEITARRAEIERQEREAQAKRDAEEKSRRDAEALMAPTPVATHKPVMPAQPRDAELCAAIVGHFAVDSMVADYWLRNYGRASKDA